MLAADHPIPQQAVRETSHIHLQPVPTAPGRHVVSYGGRRHVRADRLDDVLVLTSELVTNAVLHARTPFELGVTTTDDAVVICVGDGGGDSAEPEVLRGRESGRGIMLVRAIADDWGVGPEARPGKIVWFLFVEQLWRKAGSRA